MNKTKNAPFYFFISSQIKNRGSLLFVTIADSIPKRLLELLVQQILPIGAQDILFTFSYAQDTIFKDSL